MRTRLPLFLGVFVVMALSNAIVPILPSLATGTTAQGAIFSAYFLGAFLLVLPAGYLADRVGAVPLVWAGLILTSISGLLLVTAGSPLLLITGRLLEGFGAGLFVPAALAILNARPDHGRMSGYFMALLNLGLIVGLIGTGWLVSRWAGPYAGILLFSAASFIPLVLSAGLREGDGSHPGMPSEPAKDTFNRMKTVFSSYFWLWVSAVLMVGITGALMTLHPEYTDLPPELVSWEIALMNIATIGAILVTSHARLPPVPTIRLAALAMAGGVVLTSFSVAGFLVIGWLAGMVMISQLVFLAGVSARQGVLMGLFNTASYGGMTVLPFMAGAIAEFAGFPAAYAVIAGCALLVAGTIGRCGCSPGEAAP